MRAHIPTAALSGQQRPVGVTIRPLRQKSIAMPLGVEARELIGGNIQRRVSDLPLQRHRLTAVIANHHVSLFRKRHVPIRIERPVLGQAERQRLIGLCSAHIAEEIAQRRPDRGRRIVVPGDAHRELPQEDPRGLGIGGQIQFHLQRRDGFRARNIRDSRCLPGLNLDRRDIGLARRLRRARVLAALAEDRVSRIERRGIFL